MKRFKINELMDFVKKHGGDKLLEGQSNNQLRSLLWRGLKNRNLFFILKRGELQGIIEWYRFNSFNTLILLLQQNKIRMENINGNIVYVHKIVCKKKTIDKKLFNRFIQFHQQISIRLLFVCWWSLKKNKFIKFKLK